MNPTKRNYTHYSCPHQTYARINHVLVSLDLIPTILSSSIKDTAWSDHSLVTLTLHNLTTRQTSTQWRLNESLLSDPTKVKEINDSLKEYFALNNVDNISPELLWAAHKATVRGKLISIVTRVKRERQLDIEKLEKAFQTLKIKHKCSPTKTSMDQLYAARLELNLALTAKAEKQIHWSRAKFYVQKDNMTPCWPLDYLHGNVHKPPPRLG